MIEPLAIKEAAPIPTKKRQRSPSLSSSRFPLSKVTDEADPHEALKPEQLIRNPAGWRGWVDKPLGGDRYQVTFENGLTDDSRTICRPCRSVLPMSLQPQSLPAIPEETARVAHAAFPKGNLFIRVRDELGVFFNDQDFAALYCL